MTMLFNHLPHPSHRPWLQDLHALWVDGKGQDREQPLLLSGRALRKMQDCNRTYPDLG